MLYLPGLFPLLIALTGCAAGTEGDSGLTGSTWRFVAIDGARPASSRTSVAFQRDHLAINAGCNGMGGPWRIERGRLVAGPLIQTEMYCEGPVMDQERAVGALLAGMPEIRNKGDRIRLRSSGHSAELVRLR